MIAIKVIIFIFALDASILMIEEAMQRYLLDSKKNYDDLHYDFTHGHMETFGFRKTIIALLLWSGFYLVNLL